MIYDFYKPGGKYSYELEIDYSYRERPNHDVNEGPFTRVSYTPKVTLRSNRKPLPFLGAPFTYYMEASTANVSEEVPVAETPSPEGYTTSSPMNRVYADILYAADLGWLGKCNLGVDAAASDYGALGYWKRAEQLAGLQEEYFDHLILTYDYAHYISQDGYSPYLFEGYWYSPYDTFTGGIKVKAWWSYFSMKASYEVPSQDLFNVKYELMFGMHCYNLLFDYVIKKNVDTYQSEFDFSFELVPSRW